MEINSDLKHQINLWNKGCRIGTNHWGGIDLNGLTEPSGLLGDGIDWILKNIGDNEIPIKIYFGKNAT